MPGQVIVNPSPAPAPPTTAVAPLKFGDPGYQGFNPGDPRYVAPPTNNVAGGPALNPDGTKNIYAGTGTEIPAGKVYGGSGNSDLDSALASQAAAAKKSAGQPDPSDPSVQAQIRAQTLAAFQAEIDATNSMYASKLADAKVLGQGRLGSATATEARGGLLGSDFGNAQTDTVNQGNQGIYSGIQAEQAVAISGIMDKSNTVATQAIKDAQTARTSGLDNYVKYLQESSTRNQTNATSAAKAVLASGLDPTKLPPDQMAQYLTNYGISQDDFNKAYAAEKPGYDAAQAKAKKDSETTVAAGATVLGADGKPIYTAPEKPAAAPTSVQEFEYAVKNSGYKGTYTQWLNEDANRKNPAPKPEVNPQQQTVLNDFGKSLVDPNVQAAIKDGSMTREDLIRNLRGQYGGIGANQISNDDIAKKVYETYLDKKERHKVLGVF